MDGSTPSLLEFDPSIIPFQLNLIKDIRKNFDYSKGVHELLCSGAMGSSKSMVACHLIITHCLMYPKARVLVGRRTLTALRDTMIHKIIEHMGNDLIEGKDYLHNRSRSIFTFANGSQIIPYSWADGNYKKVRSLELSAAVIEELTENDDMKFYHEIMYRVGRLSHVKEKFVLCLTNPDDPTHPAYDYFISKPVGLRKVYYSITEDNPFLDPSYIRKLKESFDPKLARRLLYGEWLAITQDVIYYSYSREHNYKDHKYVIDQRYPIHICYDFNIGVGKPLSIVLFQFINNTFHFFDEVIIEGARTDDSMDELEGRGYFNYPVEFRVHGDATGKHRDTRSKHSDWDIIKQRLQNTKNKDGQYIRFSIEVPLSNPKVRDRHNKVNATLHNSLGHRNLFVYSDCKTLDEGFRLTKLKQNAGYIEDDSKHYQHCTTAAGYGIVWMLNEIDRPTITMLK
jgi:hypothetical protein